MKATRKITGIEYHDKLYDISKHVLGSIMEGADLELFKEQSRRERYCFVARRMAESLMEELGYVVGPPKSTPNSQPDGPDPDGSRISTIDPTLLAQLKKEKK